MKLLAFLLVPALAGAAGTYRLLYSAQGTSSFELFENEGGRSVVKRTQDYEIYRRYSEQRGEEEFLVGSARRLEFLLNQDGVKGEISWSVRGGPEFSRQLWGKSEVATELNVHEGLPVLVTGLAGCCGAMTGYRLYEIESGKQLMAFNDFSFRGQVTQPYSIEIPNSRLGTRWLGVLSADSTRDFKVQPGSPQTTPALLLSYYGGKGLQMLQVNVPKKPGYGVSVLYAGIEKDPQVKGSNKIEIIDNQIVMWNIDGETSASKISGLILRVDMDWGDGGYSLKLPIREDQLVIPKTRAPLQIELMTRE